MPAKYCNSRTAYSRFKTREVKVGNVGVGGDNPIRVQSMTTTDTMDTEATVAQSIRMIDAGCEIVRITAPSKKEAENLANIKASLVAKGYDTPIVADIHFTPNAAEIAARLIEKVRVNPGNYADKKKFEHIEYNDETYLAELDRIRERFTPLVRICKEVGTAMRIGTNHGSLSDRILSRYGDTPEGMVESAFEFLRICRDEDYHEIILSMKASNTRVMVQAYRLLVARMIEEGWNYPLHLGVTEAGEGEDGRIKSAVGIGTLLEDGLGDTVRVSLTEEPEFEIPVAQDLVNRYKTRTEDQLPIPESGNAIDPFTYQKRKSSEIHNVGGSNVPRVISDLSKKDEINPANLFGFGYRYSVDADKWNLTDLATDFIYVGTKEIDFEIPGTLGVIQDYQTWDASKKERHYPLFKASEIAELESAKGTKFLQVDSKEIFDSGMVEQLKTLAETIVILTSSNPHGMPEMRAAIESLTSNEIDLPVILKWDYFGLNESQFQLGSSTDGGALLTDGLGDGVWITSDSQSDQVVNSTVFGLMQASRTRISKTEYISCPSCGRTLFDLQETTAKIRERTDHLKGIKIGIMGCIVNGPGEMADADYGYVGVGVGKITLYKGQEVVKRAIASELALDELIELIKTHGDWVEPVALEA
ncbi:MAG: (E)-4-hydroxy-3-methylbut-2-enyl-diphosphate synthase [Flavobacteriales bacterium]|jgi:(E)-4-hydroxy-3-methylbut-2-enyl-diphosphate synthase